MPHLLSICEGSDIGQESAYKHKLLELPPGISQKIFSPLYKQRRYQKVTRYKASDKIPYGGKRSSVSEHSQDKLPSQGPSCETGPFWWDTIFWHLQGGSSDGTSHLLTISSAVTGSHIWVVLLGNPALFALAVNTSFLTHNFHSTNKALCLHATRS
jgi:hypothetical protein